MKLLFLKSFFLVAGMILTMSCSNKSLPGLQGKVRTLFKINSNGEVIQAKITSSTANNAQLEECVIKELKALKFSKNKEGTDSKVHYPFDFRPSPP